VEAFPRDIVLYETSAGRVPFDEWLESLDGQDIYEMVLLRLDNVERGSLGETRSVGEGVSELVIDHGPGYRVYYGLIGKHGDIVVLLHGGEKKTQQADIKAAKQYWNDKEFNRTDID
jgi:putative addiction module killer protein